MWLPHGRFFSQQNVGGCRLSFTFDRVINWDDKRLSLWAQSSAGPILCLIPRDAIHAIHKYNDAIGREIERDRLDIFDRLKPLLVSKVQQAILSGALGPVEVRPEDVNAGPNRPLFACDDCTFVDPSSRRSSRKKDLPSIGRVLDNWSRWL